MNTLLLRRLATTLLIVASCVGLFTVIDPTNAGFGTVQIAILKYAPYWLAGISCALYLLSCKVRLNRAETFLVLFVLVMVIGSSWASFVKGVSLDESYMGRALGGVVLIAFLLISRDERELRYYFRYFSRALTLTALVMVVIVFLYRLGLIYTELSQMYQVKSVIFASVAILSMVRLRNRMIKVLMLSLMAASLLFVQKTTALLVLVVTIAYAVYSYVVANKQVLLRSFSKTGIAGLVAMAALGVIILGGAASYDLIDTRMTSEARESEVRAITILMRVDEFSQSPIYGNMFTGSPLVEVSTLHIPSHSDVVDLLAMGGGSQFCCFFLPYWCGYSRQFELARKSMGETGYHLQSWFLWWL